MNRPTASAGRMAEPQHLDNRAVRIRLRDVHSLPMRAFHMSWLAFFLAFFGWFGIAPLMAVVREDLQLTKTQIGNTIIASVAITLLARVLIGILCDRIGPRKAYAGLLIIGSIPVMTIGLATSYEAFLLFRLAIGAIGAAFVITQYHTSVMFAPNCVGTANATTAGWGNAGGGVTQIVMPLVLTALTSLGVSTYWSWRLAMVVPGIALFVMGIAYFFLTQDTPDGARRVRPRAERASRHDVWRVLRDGRVWALALTYGACFGVELTINNVAALYFYDQFGVSLGVAGLIAGLFGCMNLFARTLGGYFGDRAGIRHGLRGRVRFLGIVILLEGVALAAFSQMALLPIAVISLLVFSVLVQMAEGATYSVVPFVDKRAIGVVTGMVGAGGTAGAVAAGFLFRSEALSAQTSFLILGAAVVATSAVTMLVRFDAAAEANAKVEVHASLRRAAMAAD